MFRSAHNGILAAREAKDGSGLLAIADKQNVVLHDTKRGQERSWGLRADDEDGVRHLEYTSDAKSIFLSTELTSDVQRYSTEQSRLLSPTKAHATSPIALAVSPTAHLIVSASDDPPTIFLSNLAHNSAPVLIEPRASEAAVTCIAFHPERPDVFLLGFADGVAAVFDATKLARKQAGALVNQESVNRGELGHLGDLHRPVLDGKRTCCIEGAAFLPGYRSRVVTVGRDGRCRLVDFAGGGVIIRTWHAQAPIVSLSVFSSSTRTTRPAIGSSRPDRRKQNPKDTDVTIAVGRIDGMIHLYDSVGLLLEQKALRSTEKIISVEWVSGKSPRRIANSIVARGGESMPSLEASELQRPMRKPTEIVKASKPSSTQRRRSTNFEHVGLPPALRKMKDLKVDGTPKTDAVRQFTIHPDEVDESTVRYTPIETRNRQLPTATRPYLDLFSPVKPQENGAQSTLMKPLGSPQRTRPKLSEQTFVREAPAEPSTVSRVIAQPQHITFSAEHESVPPKRLPNKHDRDRTGRRVTPKTSRLATTRPRSLRSVRQTHHMSGGAGPANNDNAKILADLRRLDPKGSSNQPGGVLRRVQQTDSTHKVANGVPAKKKRSFWSRPKDHIETDKDSHHALQAYDEAHEKQDWLEDSHQESSLDDDIWLTSDAETKTTTGRSRRRPHPIQRPPAGQTSRSRIDSKGTTSTVTPHADTRPESAMRPPIIVDGSTEEDMFTAEETCIGADGMLSPSSKAIQQLFPRSSSLSPHKHPSSRKSARRKGSRMVSIQQSRVLREITTNTLPPAKQTRTPWTKAKAVKEARSAVARPMKANEPQGIPRDQNGLEGHIPTADNPCCAACSDTQSRMHEVESEVARLKGEVLMLKAVLRRQGLPLPPSFRRA